MKKRALVTMIALATVLFLVLGGGCSLFHKEAPGDPAEKEADPEEAKDDDKGPGNAADSGENPREDEEDAEERTVKITLRGLPDSVPYLYSHGIPNGQNGPGNGQGRDLLRRTLHLG